MPINAYTPEQRKAIDYFMPYVDQAARKVNDAPNGPYHISAFIWRDDEENPVLLHVGNIPNKGEELVRLHYQLSCISAAIEDTGAVERAEINPATQTQTPEEIADEIAIHLLSRPTTDSETTDLIHKYLTTRNRK